LLLLLLRFICCCVSCKQREALLQPVGLASGEGKLRVQERRVPASQQQKQQQIAGAPDLQQRHAHLMGYACQVEDNRSTSAAILQDALSRGLLGVRYPNSWLCCDMYYACFPTSGNLSSLAVQLYQQPRLRTSATNASTAAGEPAPLPARSGIRSSPGQALRGICTEWKQHKTTATAVQIPCKLC
jgi:hypothetical protein